jgi:hypothetical protein
VTAESYLVFSQRIDNTRENFGVRNRKKCLGGIAGLAIQEAFNKRLFFGKKLLSLELRCFGLGVFQIRSSS